MLSWEDGEICNLASLVHGIPCREGHTSDLCHEVTGPHPLALSILGVAMQGVQVIRSSPKIVLALTQGHRCKAGSSSPLPGYEQLD